MFNKVQTVDTRMAVIEEKFNVYEKMMDKLESAIQTISEINQNISRMLSVHEEKIDSAVKTDDIIFEKFRRLEEKNTQEHKQVIQKIEDLEKTIEDNIKTEKKERSTEIKTLNNKILNLSKIKWGFFGGIAVISLIISHSSTIVNILTPNQSPAIVKPASK